MGVPLKGPPNVCLKCGEEKPRIAKFWPPCKTCSDGLRRTCKTCRNGLQKTGAYRKADTKRSRRYRLANRDKINARRAETRLIGGLLTPKEYASRLKKQRGKCAICKKAKASKPSPGHVRRRVLSVDHDHATMRVRGLLCHSCNAGLGHFKDSPELLQAAVSYLRQ